MCWEYSKHPAVLQKLFKYDHNSGELTPKMRGASKPAIGSSGYLHAKSLGRKLPAHCIAWAIYYGEWPKYIVDHINRNRSDNRIENLRYVTAGMNMQNKSVGRNSASGIKGVRFDNKSGMFVASISVAGVYVYLGSYFTKDKAVAVRKAAEVRYHIQPEDRPIKAPLPFMFWDLFEMGPWSTDPNETKSWEVNGLDYFAYMESTTPF